VTKPRPAALLPDSFTTFGDLLKHLRLRAGLTQRDLAIAVGYHYAHLSRIENNQRAPEAAVVVARFIPALGLDRQPEWSARLIELAQTTEVKPPPPTDSANNRFPRPLTALLGRDAEVETLCALLQRPDTRLLTLIGPPGVGKTRLALQVGAELVGTLAQRAVWVELATIQDTAQVVTTIAAALDLKESRGPSLAALIGEKLRGQPCLLALDNFEQVLEAAPAIGQILATAPQLKVLVTSRAPLRLLGEQEFPVVPLILPDLRHLPSAAEDLLTSLAPLPVMQLFVQRARAVQPNFELNAANVRPVAEICARLDGLPLAIELAAARIRLFSPAALLKRLEHRLQWLTDGTRDSPAWRRSLRGAIDWSYTLLAAADREFFAQLGVFSGSFTAAAASAVGGEPAADPESVLERLMILADQSLIKGLSELSALEPRFILLETLREFALEQLQAQPTVLEAAYRAHATHYAQFSSTAQRELKGTHQAQWLDQLETEYENLRAALEWLFKRGDNLAVTLTANLSEFWIKRGHLSEGRRWLTLALDHTDTLANSERRVTILQALGETLWHLGDFGGARARLEEGLALARASQPLHQPAIANALNALGRLLKDQGDYIAAKHYLEESRALAQAMGEINTLIHIHLNLGNVNVDLGHLSEAKTCYQLALGFARQDGDRYGLAGALNNLGVVEILDKNYVTAQARFSESLQIFREDGHKFGMANSLVNLGRIAKQLNQFEDSRRMLEESLAFAEEIEKPWTAAYALNNLGLLACEQQQWAEAEQRFRGALRKALEAGAAPRGLDGLIGWAVLYQRREQLEQAAELVGLVLSHPATEHEAIERAQEVLADLKTRLPADTLQAALERKQQLDWVTVAEALAKA